MFLSLRERFLNLVCEGVGRFWMVSERERGRDCDSCVFLRDEICYAYIYYAGGLSVWFGLLYMTQQLEER